MSHWGIMAIWRQTLTSLKLILSLPFPLPTPLPYFFELLHCFYVSLCSEPLLFALFHIHRLQVSSSLGIVSHDADSLKVTKYCESDTTSVVAGWDFFNNNIHNEYQLIVYTAKRMGIITIISSIGDWSIKYTYLGLRIDMRSADKQDYIDCLMRLTAS